jgi:hypothetical protein
LLSNDLLLVDKVEDENVDECEPKDWTSGVLQVNLGHQPNDGTRVDCNTHIGYDPIKVQTHRNHNV